MFHAAFGSNEDRAGFDFLEPFHGIGKRLGSVVEPHVRIAVLVEREFDDELTIVSPERCRDGKHDFLDGRLATDDPAFFLNLSQLFGLAQTVKQFDDALVDDPGLPDDDRFGELHGIDRAARAVDFLPV